jgi:hypothetical protein
MGVWHLTVQVYHVNSQSQIALGHEATRFDVWLRAARRWREVTRSFVSSFYIR